MITEELLDLCVLDQNVGLKVSLLIELHSATLFLTYEWLVVCMFAKMSEAFTQSWQNMRATLESANEQSDL